MEMTAKLEQKLEKSFIDEIGIFIGPCNCNNISCPNVMYKFVGKDSDLEYILEYDEGAEAGEAVNIVVYIKENDVVVFNGRCDNNHDLAQVLRMTAI
jgi:hypothetical protein